MMPMRTTLTLPDDLMKLARKRAAAAHRTLKDVINEALRLGLSSSGKPQARRQPFTLPSFKGDGVLPGVDLESNSDLQDRMDGL